MLDFRGNVHHVAGVQFPRLLSPLLIIAAPGGAKQDLPALVMDMSIVAAAGGEGDVADGYALHREHIQVALPHKIGGEGSVFFTGGGKCR